MKSFYKYSSLFCVLISLSMLAASQKLQKPNILIIVADDLGWGDVGYHGSPIQTPNIDRLAKQGVELNRFYTAAVCSPTRAGLLTGRYPDRMGLRTVIPPWSDFGIDTNEVFLPQMLTNAGYTNRAIIGKWHLGHAKLKYYPLSRGFTHFYGHLNGNIDYFTHEREDQLDWHNNFQTSYEKGYSTDLLADEAIKNIRSYSQTAPFFLYLAFNAPHAPLQAKEKDLLKYDYDATQSFFNNTGKFGDQGRGNTKKQTYAAMVSCMDESIGKVLQELDDLHIADNTIVIFMSDNGAAVNEGGSSGNLRGHKGTEWEGGVRAPAIIRWPAGFKGGKICEQVTGYIDIVPTLLDIEGVKLPIKNKLDGISILPVLKGTTPGINRNMYLGFGAIVNKDWKLIEGSTASKDMQIAEDQFFHISADPYEKINIPVKQNAEYNSLKKALQVYKTILPSRMASSYNQGKKGFMAPKEWQVK